MHRSDTLANCFTGTIIIACLAAIPFAWAASVARAQDSRESPSFLTGSRGESPESELALQAYLFLLAPDAYDGYLEAANNSPLVACIEAALFTCGQGQVCSVHVINNSCAFTCQDAEGHCPPGPTPDPDPDPDISDF